MQNKYEAVDSIKEISLEELDQIIGAGKNGVFKTISHEYRMNSFQFYSLVVLNVMSLVILDVATKRGKPRHCTLIMGHKKNTFMRPVFCTLQETDHLIFVEF